MRVWGTSKKQIQRNRRWLKHKPIHSIQWDADNTDGKTAQQYLLLNSRSQESLSPVPTMWRELFPPRHKRQFCFFGMSVCRIWQGVHTPTDLCRSVAWVGCSPVWPSKASFQMSAAVWVSPQKWTPADKKPFLWPNKSLLDSRRILHFCFSSSSSLPIKKRCLLSISRRKPEQLGAFPS